MASLFCGWAAGQAAVAAWLLGVLRVAMEWATVPVLALAMALPHGALVYWLSSSACSLAQVVRLSLPALSNMSSALLVCASLVCMWLSLSL